MRGAAVRAVGSRRWRRGGRIIFLSPGPHCFRGRPSVGWRDEARNTPPNQKTKNPIFSENKTRAEASAAPSAALAETTSPNRSTPANTTNARASMRKSCAGVPSASPGFSQRAATASIDKTGRRRAQSSRIWEGA